MSRPLPLQIRNILLLLLCGLPGIFCDNEVNHLQSTIRQNKATLYPSTTSSLDYELRKNGVSPASRAAPTRQRWNADLLKINPRRDPTQEILPIVGQAEDEEEEDDKEKSVLTTTVRLPSYFSYSTTRRANARDRVNNINNTNNELKNKIVYNKRNEGIVDAEDDSTTTPTTFSKSTMTFSSDILKLTTSRSTSKKTTNIDIDEPQTKYSPSTVRSSRILTGRRKVNNDDVLTSSSVKPEGDIISNQFSYLERIQQQLQTTDLTPTTGSTRFVQGYHDLDGKNVEHKVVEVKKKPMKKDSENIDLLSNKTSNGGKQQTFKESLLSKPDLLVKIKESSVFNETSKPTDKPEALDKRFSTIIDTLSNGNINIQSNIGSHNDKLVKNITLNNEPGTNLLETDSGNSKEATEKRETDESNADNQHRGTNPLKDVIPVIIRNSVAAESVGEFINKTGTLNFSTDDKPVNESVLMSSTSVTNVNSQPFFKSGDDINKDGSSLLSQGVDPQLSTGLKEDHPEHVDKSDDLGHSTKVTLSKVPTPSSKVAEFGDKEENSEVKKKIFSLKKPTLVSSSNSIVKSGESETIKNETSEDFITPFTSSTVPSPTVPKQDELYKTRIGVSSSTSRISSSVSSSRTQSSSLDVTTFASNNMENNIITTLAPMVSTSTPSTPKRDSIRTSSDQPQPSTSAGENLIKQITSFNSRKRPTGFFQSSSSISTTKPDSDQTRMTIESEIISKTEHPTNSFTYTSTGQGSSSSMRPSSSTIKKIVPWSTRLQKTTGMPETTVEITTIDYINGNTTPHNQQLPHSSSMQFTTSRGLATLNSTAQDSTTVVPTLPTATFSPSTTTESSTMKSSSFNLASLSPSSTTEVSSSQTPETLSDPTSESPIIIDLLDPTNGNVTQNLGNVSTSTFTSDSWATTLETGVTSTELQYTIENSTEISSSLPDDLDNHSVVSKILNKGTDSDDLIDTNLTDTNTWPSVGHEDDYNSTGDNNSDDVVGRNTSWIVQTTIKTSSVPKQTTLDATTSRGVLNTTLEKTSIRVEENIDPIARDHSHNVSSTLRPITTTSSIHDTEDFFDPDDEEVHTTTTFPPDGEYEPGNEEEDDRMHANYTETTMETNHVTHDNRIIKNRTMSEVVTKATTVSSEKDNIIVKITSTMRSLDDVTYWTTVDMTEVTTTSSTVKSVVATIPYTPSHKVRPMPTRQPMIPVTHKDESKTSPPQYMGLSLLVKGTTMQGICEAKPSLKKAIMVLFRNTTGRILYENQIHFPSLTPDKCAGADSEKIGFHEVDLVLYDANGHINDDLISDFRMLWENNGLSTNIAIHEVYLVLRHDDVTQSSSITIAVIVISCIGLACLLLFFILMMVLRKRQKKFNYGQRCTPVSLDDYSLDNISVYNSMRRKNALRASKRSYGNPAFDDPSAPSHPMNFAALAHFSTNRKAIDDEFTEIPMVNPKMDELIPGAETKNRYANVIPLPETRVQLSVKEGDNPLNGYINANYVKGPKGAPKYYIACQAPMQSTVNDFWKMIWEQQTKLVLMLTDLHENGVEKCFDYLPPSEVLDCHRLFGDYQVTLKKREVREKYVISHLQLKNLDSNLWREVTHMWYTSWPHQGVPTEGTSIIAFVIEARSYMRNTSGPHVVHCSPGVGRTGTVLAIDLCIREFETSRMVDVPKTVYGLRRNRAGCVQTKDQYAFIYTVLNIYGTKLTGGALDSM